MASTASELTIEHYQRPEVKAIITKFAMPGDGTWRALNGDFHRWYAYEGDNIRLLTPDDYDFVTDHYRTLYQTLNVFDQGLWGSWMPSSEKSGKNPLGKPTDTMAYSLSVDIDAGPGCDIRDPPVKQAVEGYAQYLIDYLKANGVYNSVWPLFSGGGIYVQVHHGICAPSDGEGRHEFFENVTDRFNELIDQTKEDFLKAQPEREGKVKPDALNNSKRIFKCILSAHKSRPYAVTPLNREKIEIDFDRATIPLKDDIIQEAKEWYSTYDPSEREPFMKLLEQFKSDGKRKKHQFKEISRSANKVDITHFPPCMRHIMDTANTREGKTRFSGVISAFLYSAGWSDEEAWDVVGKMSDRNGVGNAGHIFDSCFGRISCPSCETIENDGTGYPHMGLKGLGVCNRCEWCEQHPMDYVMHSLLDSVETTKEPSIRILKPEDPVGTYGLNAQTGAVCKMMEFEGENGKFRKMAWVSDCAVHIYKETKAKDDGEFTFVGRGAVDKREVKFTMPSSFLAEPKKFKGALINAFGAKNKVGSLTFPAVQDLSQNPKVMRRIEAPTWDGNNPLIPGVGLTKDVEYDLSPMIPAEVYDGDLGAAKDCLRKLMDAHKYGPIMAAFVFGAPAVARWHKNDRYGVAAWGETGTLKTSYALAMMGIYGIGYLDGPKLKAGKDGSTTVGAMEMYVAAGFLAQLYDNVKGTNPKDVETYVSINHAVLEGLEKARGKKDGGMRESRGFNSSPMITGEIKPSEASTTARILNLNWTMANGELLKCVQTNASVLPVLGYHWLRFLARTDSVLGVDFEDFRTKQMEEFLKKGFVNPGRLASIFALQIASWELLEQSPLGDVFKEYKAEFKKVLNEAIGEQGRAVTEETEVSKFVSAVQEIIASDPGIVADQRGNRATVRPIIGQWMLNGVFLLPQETLDQVMRMKAFTQIPTKESLTQALNEKGLLIHKDDRLLYQKRIAGRPVRGWYLKIEVPDTKVKDEEEIGGEEGGDVKPPQNPPPSGDNVPPKDPLSPSTGDTEIDSGKADFPIVTGETTVTPKNQRIILSKEEKILNDFSGDSGYSGDREEEDKIDRSIDIDLLDINGTPSVTGSVTKASPVEKTGIGPHPRRDLPTPKSYSSMVKFVPTEYSSESEAKICRVCRGMLFRGIAPRVDDVARETGLDKADVAAYFKTAAWREDGSSPAGIKVYLPKEVSA